METSIATLQLLLALLLTATAAVAGLPIYGSPSVLLEEGPAPTPKSSVKWIQTSKNPYCKVEKDQAAIKCGVIDLIPAEGDGVVLWKPDRCSDTGCKCVPVREVTVQPDAHQPDAHPETLTKNLKKYRIFECA